MLGPLVMFRFKHPLTHSSMHPKTKCRFAGAGAQDAADDGAALDKAQLRRAQVRKAQSQHRQRKANYVKQLEMDVARIRDMTEAAGRETQALLDENKAIRAQIQHAVANQSLPISLDQSVSMLIEMPEPTQLSSDTRASLPQELDALTVTLGFDEVMNAPTFYISSPPPCSTHSHSPQDNNAQPEPTSTANDLPDLTPAQAQAAINFILA